MACNRPTRIVAIMTPAAQALRPGPQSPRLRGSKIVGTVQTGSPQILIMYSDTMTHRGC